MPHFMWGYWFREKCVFPRRNSC